VTNTPAPRFVVRCEDGRIRHLHDPFVANGSFTSRHAAAVWADQGHVCTVHHTIEAVTPLGTTGCVVLPGIDGPSLWDCECAACVAIQDESYNDDGPCCSICDGLGHGYPGGPPCPLEVCDYSGEPEWAL
jgi:hypothetical protein